MQHFGDGLLNFVFFLTFETHAERDVFIDVQVREKRVFLENRIDGALMRRHVIDLLVTKKDIAAIRCDEAADGAAKPWFCPQPEGPSSVTNSPSPMVRLKFFKTCSPSNDTAMSLSVMIGFNMESIPFAVWWDPCPPKVARS